MHYKPKTEIREYSINNHQNVFVGNRKMIVLVGESGKWEARFKGRIRVKDTAEYTSCLLQSSETMAVSTYITDATTTECTSCTLRHNRQQIYHHCSALIFTHEHNYLQQEEKGTQIFHRRKNDDMKQGKYWEPTGIRRNGRGIRSIAVYEVPMIDCYLLLRKWRKVVVCGAQNVKRRIWNTRNFGVLLENICIFKRFGQ